MTKATSPLYALSSSIRLSSSLADYNSFLTALSSIRGCASCSGNSSAIFPIHPPRHAPFESRNPLNNPRETKTPRFLNTRQHTKEPKERNPNYSRSKRPRSCLVPASSSSLPVNRSSHALGKETVALLDGALRPAGTPSFSAWVFLSKGWVPIVALLQREARSIMTPGKIQNSNVLPIPVVTFHNARLAVVGYFPQKRPSPV